MTTAEASKELKQLDNIRKGNAEAMLDSQVTKATIAALNAGISPGRIARILRDAAGSMAR